MFDDLLKESRLVETFDIKENAKKAILKHIAAEKAILKELRKKEGKAPVL